MHVRRFHLNMSNIVVFFIKRSSNFSVSGIYLLTNRVFTSFEHTYTQLNREASEYISDSTNRLGSGDDI